MIQADLSDNQAITVLLNYIENPLPCLNLLFVWKGVGQAIKARQYIWMYHQNASGKPRPSGRGGKEAVFRLPVFCIITFSSLGCETMKRAYKYRFYPTPDQVELLAQTFGCVRFVYNSILRWRTDAYYERKEKIGYLQANARLTALKKESEYA